MYTQIFQYIQNIILVFRIITMKHNGLTVLFLLFPSNICICLYLGILYWSKTIAKSKCLYRWCAEEQHSLLICIGVPILMSFLKFTVSHAHINWPTLWIALMYDVYRLFLLYKVDELIFCWIYAIFKTNMISRIIFLSL